MKSADSDLQPVLAPNFLSRAFSSGPTLSNSPQLFHDPSALPNMLLLDRYTPVEYVCIYVYINTCISYQRALHS